MPRKIQILTASTPTDPVLELTIVFWFDVPTDRRARFIDPAKESALADITPADKTALRAGQFTEYVATLRWDDAADDETITDRIAAYAEQVERSIIGPPVARTRIFRSGMRYDPTTGNWIQTGPP